MANLVIEATGALIGASDEFADVNGPFGGLIEKAATNVALRNRDQTNAVWVKSNMTAAKDETGLDARLNSASSLLATAANATALQTFTILSTEQDTSFYLKRLIGSGTVEITIDNGVTFVPVTLTSSFQRFDVTQTLANPVIGIRIVTSGDKIAVDFSHLETGPIPTSEIETAASSVGRNADVLAYATTGNLAINNGSIKLDWVPTAAAQGTIFIWGTFVDVNNSTAILHDGTNIIFRKRIGGVNNDATKLLTYTKDSVNALKATYSAVDGIQIFVNDVAGTGDADTADIQIGSDFEVGSDGNSANHQVGSVRFLQQFASVI